jgi:hypothetical protein
MSGSGRAGWVWCLPALLAGLALRFALTVAMPLGYWHPDSGDLLQTAAAFVADGSWVCHGKKTFLIPAIYAGWFWVTDWAAFWAVVVQHLLGLVCVAQVGWLVRAWFPRWRWWVVPATLFAALHPALVWYEHMLMTESWMVLAVTTLAVAGTRFARDRSQLAFAGLAGALAFIASTRPEGKLWWLYGVLLVVWAGWGRWRVLAAGLGLLAVLFLLIRPGLRTTQAPMLLLSTMVHWAPDEVPGRPGLGERIRPVRDTYLERWKGEPFDLARCRKDIDAILETYMAEHPMPGMNRREYRAALTRDLTRSILWRDGWRVPSLAWRKFSFQSRGLAGDEFSPKWLRAKQVESMANSREELAVLGARLGGGGFDVDRVEAFLEARTPTSVPWFESFTAGWTAFFALPAAGPLPLWLWLALAGLLLHPVAAYPGGRVPAGLWAGTVFAMLFTVMLTANVRPRFRCQFEIPLMLASVATLEAVARGATRRAARVA